MGAQQRQEIIQKIESLRGSKVLTYITGDRGPTGANIGDDAVRPIVEHLRQMGSAERLDVFVYSRGGAIDVPWRLNSAFRRTARRWDALVPFRANSAATLLCLGADEIVLGPQGELGPIDPIMSISRATPTGPAQEQVSVEDVMAFARFVTERFELREEESLSLALAKLVDRLDAVTLGSAFRTHSHIRYLAKKMLTSRGDESSPLDADKVEHIIETLAERVYAHGHAIGLEEASEIGLPAVLAEDDLDAAMWSLLEQYEEDLRLLEPLDQFNAVQTQDRYTEDVVLAVVESATMTHEFSGRLDIQAQRQFPQSLQVQLNMPIQLPPGLDPSQLPANLQQLLQNVQQELVQAGHAAVEQALRAQAPLVGCNLRLLDARWRRI